MFAKCTRCIKHKLVNDSRSEHCLNPAMKNSSGTASAERSCVVRVIVVRADRSNRDNNSASRTVPQPDWHS